MVDKKQTDSPEGMTAVGKSTGAMSRRTKMMIIAGIVMLAVGLGVGLGVGLAMASSSSSDDKRPVVEMAFVASGDPSDFTDTTKNELKAKVGGEVGAKPSDVELTITPASVLLKFRIKVANDAAATAAISSLQEKVASTDAASSFLSVDSMTLTIESIVKAPALVDSSASPSPPPSISPPPAIVGFNF